jgi:acetaldehyde dehydrogenase
LEPVGCAIIGSGNIGTDLLIKIQNRNGPLDCKVLVGIDADSAGLARARELGVATTHDGIDGLLAHPEWESVQIVFDATSAQAHLAHAAVLKEHGRLAIDLTPAAVGPGLIPVAGIPDRDAAVSNVNMVTCGGQATIPIVWAVSEIAPVCYGEIVASIASRSAGPGTRANIDEFTQTTARGIETLGRAKLGKAIIILNPAEPPLIMRDTVYCFVEHDEPDPSLPERIAASIRGVVARVAEYVPGYRLVKPPVFEDITDPLKIPGFGTFRGTKVTTFLEVEGAGDWLPRYAGNLDIMTSAALRVGELFAES